MCIPPEHEEPALHFALLREIGRRNGLNRLSMGMSADYEAAIQLGVWAAEGKIQNRVHVVDGFLETPRAVNMLFTGENTGKLVVKV